MSYRVQAGKVYWKGKKLKLDAESFLELDSGFARDRHQVFYLGKAQKLCPETFQKLDQTYLKDQNSVFLIMASKLKPVKADPATFQSLGHQYGRDATRIFWKEKWVRQADVTSFQAVDLDIGADKKGLFLSNHRRVKTKTDQIDSVRAWRNEHSTWLRVGNKGYHLSYDWVQEMPTPDWDSFQPLVGEYARDKSRLFFKDRLCEGVQPKGHYRLINDDEQTMTNEEHCLCFGHARDGIDVTSLTTMDEYLLDRNAIYDTCGELVTKLQTGTETDLVQVVRRILDRQFLLLERLHPVGSRPEWDWYEKQRVSFQAETSIGIESEQLVLEFEGQRYSGPFLSLPRLASQIWTRSVYGQEFVRYFHETGVSYPDGALQLIHMLETGGPDMATLVAKHFPGEAHRLAILVGKLLGGDRRLLSWGRLPYSALKDCSIPYPDSTVTTNLARAREILRLQTHLHQDYVKRAAAAFELYGLTETTNKIAIFLKEIGPEVLTAWRAETCEGLKHQWLSVLGQLASSAFVKAEVRGENHYEMVKPIIELLVEQGFNLDLNLARLCECEFYQSSQFQSRETLLALTGDRRMSAMWSGLHGDFPNAEFWLVAARLRCGYHRGQAQDTLDAVMSDLDRLRRDHGEAEIFASLVNEADDFARNFKLEFEHISAPKEELYTCLSYQEHLMNQADFRLGDILWNPARPRHFILDGWPWGRQITVELQVGSWTGQVELSLGLVTQLPEEAPTPKLESGRAHTWRKISSTERPMLLVILSSGKS